MKKRIDWNCRLLPGFSDQVLNTTEALLALDILHTQFGITEFAFFPLFDPLVDSGARFLLQMNASCENLQANLPFSTRIIARPSVYLRPELPDLTLLKRFCIPKTDFLAFSLPIVPDPETENTLAKVVRHLPYRILILDAQILPAFYSKEALDRILNLPGIALQISFQSLFSPDFTVFLQKTCQKGIPVVLGSGANSIARAKRVQFDKTLENAREFHPETVCNQIFYGGLPHS